MGYNNPNALKGTAADLSHKEIRRLVQAGDEIPCFHPGAACEEQDGRGPITPSLKEPAWA